MTRDPGAAPASILSSFSQRFAVAPVAEGGVLLDLSTGTVYELNAAATLIGAGLARGDTRASIERELAEAFGLTPAAADQDLSVVLAQLEDAAADTPAHTPPSFLSFAADPDGLLMQWQGEPLLRIDPHGRTVTAAADPARLTLDPELVLKWAAPHLLALQHQPVLHASAVQREGEVVAFAGYSSAGKSTLSRLFAAEGAPRISEDLLVVSVDQGTPRVLVNGEAVLHQWAASNSPLLAGPERAAIDAGGLAEAVRGATLPLREVLLIDRARRSGDTIETGALPQSGALVSLLSHGFAELHQRDVWMELLELLRAIVSAVPVAAATVPEGLEALQAAVRRYSTTTAS